MSEILIGVIGLLVLFVLLIFRMPVGLAMMAVGFVGIAVLNNWGAALSYPLALLCDSKCRQD